MTSFLAVVQVLLVFALISLVLMHSGRDAGMGGMGFTPASGLVMSTRSGDLDPGLIRWAEAVAQYQGMKDRGQLRADMEHDLAESKRRAAEEAAKSKK